MALGDLWNRTLVYFGIAEEDEWDDDTAAAEELERSYEERRANVRRLAPRKRERDYDDWTDSGTASTKTETTTRVTVRRIDRRGAGPGCRGCLVACGRLTVAVGFIALPLKTI